MYKIKLDFGTIKNAYPKYSLVGLTQGELLQRPQLAGFNAHHLIILNQVHSVRGYHADTPDHRQLAPYAFEGDYSITRLPYVALAIETADCIPLIIFDPLQGIIAAVHAGWRGVKDGIVAAVCADLKQQGSRMENLQVFLGPSARSCCYEVAPDFESMWPSRAGFERRGQQIFFDLPTQLLEQLHMAGVDAHNICTEHLVCTICSKYHCSYRRQKELNLRQMTIVALKSI